MELLEGQTVDHLWDRLGRRLPARSAAAIGHHLLEVLAAAHTKGVVHRDIKPANLFLTNDGTLKVLDFGIARLRESSDVSHTTNTGTFFGTPAFMAPEQASGRFRDVDDLTDLWAVGATLFTLISGRIVHDAENSHALLLAASTADAPSLGAVVPDAPGEIVEVVDRALRRIKAERWPSARAMREALSAAHLRAFGVEIGSESLRVEDVEQIARRGASAVDTRVRVVSPMAETQEALSSDAHPDRSNPDPTLLSGHTPHRVVVDDVHSNPAAALARTALAPELSTSAPVSAPTALPGGSPPCASASPTATERFRSEPSGGLTALVVGGLGVAGLAVGGAFGLSASSQWSNAKQECKPGACGPGSQAQNDRDAAQTSAGLSTALFVAGGAGLAASVVLWWLGPPNVTGGSDRALRVAPLVTTSAAGFDLGGRF